MSDWNKIEKELASICKIDCGRCFSDFTSFGVGGPAKIMAFPENRRQLEKIMTMLWQFEIPNIPIGRGTNLLVADSGYNGIAVMIDGKIDNVLNINHEIWRFEAGASITEAIEIAAKAGYGGMERLAGIPGSVGGAVKMNAGAYGTHFFDFTESFEVIIESGFANLNSREIDANYRNAVFPEPSVIVSADKKKKKDDTEAIMVRIDDFRRQRTETQPIGDKSAGCIFKNPQNNHAGMLIENAELKGFQIGGAMVSDVHGNFIINTKNATADEIMRLIEKIRTTVHKKFGIVMELEIITLGFND